MTATKDRIDRDALMRLKRELDKNWFLTAGKVGI
jgi:hypothetical protein